MACPDSLTARQTHSVQSLKEHFPSVIKLHHRALNELIPSLASSTHSTPHSIQLATRFLDDKLNLFRFLKRAKFNLDDTLLTLSLCLQWRLNTHIDLLSPSAISPLYLEEPLFFFHPQLTDKWSRPCGVLNLKHVCRTDDGSLEDLKEYIAWSWELGRRFLQDSNAEIVDGMLSQCANPSFAPLPETVPVRLQMVVIVDLKDASLSNLEVELLPYFIDLLKSNFPGMVGAIFILNYGWMYSGMWQLAKRILPQPTLDRIMFPSQKDLLKFFHPGNLLAQHGGELQYEYSPRNNPIITRYAKSFSAPEPETPAENLATPVAEISPALSRKSSLESLRDLFFSAPTTPAIGLSAPSTPSRMSHVGQHARVSWLSMTSVNSGQNSPIARHQRHQSLSISKLGEAMRYNLTKQGGREWPMSQESAAPLLRSAHPLRDFRLHMPDRFATDAITLSENASEDEVEEDATPTNSVCSATTIDAGEVGHQAAARVKMVSIPLPDTPWAQGSNHFGAAPTVRKPNSQADYSFPRSASQMVNPSTEARSLTHSGNEPSLTLGERDVELPINPRPRKRDVIRGLTMHMVGLQRDARWQLTLLFSRLYRSQIDIRLVALLLLFCYRRRFTNNARVKQWSHRIMEAAKIKH